ncbi:bacillithiol system redox-active protein YtxJ [Paenibacillus marinisediminis]
MIAIQSEEALLEMIQQSVGKPLVLFKHSTRCPISSAANEEMKKIEEDFQDRGINFGLIYVVENRDVSLACAKLADVKHESPQVIVLQDNKVLWNQSHYAIRYDRLEPVLSELC